MFTLCIKIGKMFVTRGAIMLKYFIDILYMGFNLSEHDKYIVTIVACKL